MRIEQMSIKNKYSNSTLYTLTWDTASAGQDHIGSCIIKDVYVHKPENVNNRDLNNTSSPLMYVVITAVWTVLVNICNLEL
jgi:hypothetical protein